MCVREREPSGCRIKSITFLTEEYSIILKGKLLLGSGRTDWEKAKEDDKDKEAQKVWDKK